MKQTAVEWFASTLSKVGLITQDDFDSLVKQAKEMEIKQSHDYAEFAIKFSEYCALYSYKNRNMYGEMLHAPTKYDDLYTTKELLEKFKNTNNDSN
jgi:hypothetical protein